MRIVRYSGDDRPCESAMRRGKSNIYQVFDDSEELAEGSVVLSPLVAMAAIPKKKTLDPAHPLYDKRIIEPVPAGFPGDLFIDIDGKVKIFFDSVEYDYDEWRNPEPSEIDG